MSNSIKIRPVGVELIHSDGRTDITKLTVAFRNFANTPKIYIKVQLTTWVGLSLFLSHFYKLNY